MPHGYLCRFRKFTEYLWWEGKVHRAFLSALSQEIFFLQDYTTVGSLFLLLFQPGRGFAQSPKYIAFFDIGIKF